MESHHKFRCKFDYPFGLLADTSHSVCETYGVWQEKSMMGKKYMGVARTTYLVAPDGTVAHLFEQVKAEGHAEEVLAALSGAAGSP